MRVSGRVLAAAVAVAMSVTLVQVAPASSSTEGLPNPFATDEPTPDPEPTRVPTPDPTPEPGPTCAIAPYTACPEADLSGRDLRGVNLTGANLIRANLDRVNAAGATLSSADLVSATVSGATLDGAVMERTDLTHAVMTGASAQRINGQGMDASRANLQGTSFAGSDLSGANLTEANLGGVRLADANLRGASLRGADLAGVDLMGADLSGAVWVDGTVCEEGSIGECRGSGQDGPVDPTTCVLKPYANCSKANLVGRNLKGLDLTGIDLLEAQLDGADATGATLANADVVRASMLGMLLTGANLDQANVTNSVLGSAVLREVTGVGLDASRSDVSKADFTDAVLTGATFAGADATGAVFANARLGGADLSVATFSKADLSGADLTNAVLRRANLKGADLKGVVLTGADLTGATWTNGRTCGEDSIGRCRPESLPQGELDQAQLGSTSVFGVISGAIAIARFVSECNRNLPETGSCFDSGQRASFANLQRGIDELTKQIERNQQELRAALNLIIENQKKAVVAERFRQVQDDLFRARVAALKYEELTACLDALDKGRTNCELTNSNGVDPQPWALNGVEDVYRGSGATAAGAVEPATWRPNEDMQRQGPVARLLFATLYQFGGGAAGFSPTSVKEKGLKLQSIIAGDSGMLSDGLLPATVDWENARLNTNQGATAGSTPAYIPGTYLQQVNQWAAYYLQGQAAFYAPVLAAFTLLNGADGTPPIVRELQSQIDKGGLGNPQWALQNQLDTYFTDLAKVAIDTGSGATANRPDTVGFVIGNDLSGRKPPPLYRVSYVYGPTEYTSAHPDFILPTWGVLDAVQRGLARSGVKMSTLQRLYPNAIPGGKNAAWFAKYGTSYRVVDVQSYSGSGEAAHKWEAALIPNQAPQSIKWGDNVTYARHDRPCEIPVRMMDERPTFDAALKLDAGSSKVGSDNNSAIFTAKAVSGSKLWFDIRFDVANNYYSAVITSAVPAFNIVRARYGDAKGTGVLYKCGGGRMNDYSQVVPGHWVRVEEWKPIGVLRLLNP